jgi:putative membrane protein
MMDGMGGGFMWFGWIFGVIFIGLIIWVVIAIVNKNQNQNSNQSLPGNETPLDILRKRYARGEITKDEFDEMKRAF